MKMSGNTSVRTRLTVWNMAVLAVVLAAFAGLVHFSVRTVLLASVDRDLLREAGSRMFIRKFPAGPTERTERVELERNVSKTAFGFKQEVSGTRQFTVKLDRVPPNLPDFLKSRSSARHEFMVVRMVDLSGHDLPMSAGISALAKKNGELPIRISSFLDVNLFGKASSGRQGFATVVADNHPMRVFSKPLEEEGRITGVVQVAYPLDELSNLLRGLDWTLVGLIPAALLVTGIGGTLITKKALLPVRRISQAAAKLEATDLSSRLPVTGWDEFAELASTFNGMFARLESSFERLEGAVEDQRRFTADASHELRTPLTTIKANVSWALRKNRPEREYREALEAADEAADRMNRIVEDLLTLVRLDCGRLDLELDSVSVNDLLARTAGIASVRPGDEKTSSAKVIVQLADPNLCVHGDSHHLTRLLGNLIENALRHTLPSGSVRLSACERGPEVRIRVQDNGEGIAPEHVDRVCERFYRVDPSRNRSGGGVGLGLAICKSIAEAHGGRLEIKSGLGSGTMISVTLPKSGPPGPTSVLTR